MLPLFRGSRKNIYQKGFYYLQNIKKLRPLKRGNALKNEKNQIIEIVIKHNTIDGSSFKSIIIIIIIEQFIYFLNFLTFDILKYRSVLFFMTGAGSHYIMEPFFSTPLKKVFIT
jgi:UDP-N-acetylglucosamine pyrophosphorylase